jgi:hypothetical protein
MANLDDEDVAKIADALQSTFDKRRVVAESLHQEHHTIVIPRIVAFIDSELADRLAAKERREKIKTHVWGWGIIMFLSGIGAAVYQWFQRFVEINGGH